MQAVGLDSQGIVVWVIPIDSDAVSFARAQQFLTEGERNRADAFRSDAARKCFIIARSTLRVLLAGYLRCPSQAIRFVLQRNGKPTLGRFGSQLGFNTSHSGDLILHAFTIGSDVGVDTEQIRPIGDVEEIARRFLCPEETQDILLHDPVDRSDAFLRCWTRKEAFTKAVGDGLSMPLSSFRVTVRHEEPARFVHIDHKSPDGWNLDHLAPRLGYVGAIAYRGQRRAISMLEARPQQLLVDISI